MSEARFFTRSKVRFPATLTGNDTQERAVVVDLSEGGMYAEVKSDRYRQGDTIVANVHIPGRPNAVRTKGVVVRSDAAREDGTRGVAVEWSDLDDAQAKVLSSVIEEREPMVWDDGPNNVVPREVALQFIPIIRRIGKRFAARLPPHVSVEDLLGAGFVALIEIYRKHQNLPMEELERVAMKRLRGAMLDELRAVDPLSRRTRVRERRIAETRRDLESRLGRAVSHDEVRSSLKLNAQMYDQTLIASQASRPASIDALASFDIADEHSDPFAEATRREGIDKLRVALDALPPRLRRVLELYYGEELTLREIGKMLGVTEARMSQLVAEAVRRMRDTYPDEEIAAKQTPSRQVARAEAHVSGQAPVRANDEAPLSGRVARRGSRSMETLAKAG